MKKKDIKYYFIIILIFIIIIIFEISKPKPIDWSFTLEKEDKIPYGTFVLYNILEDLFPEKQISINEETIFEFSSDINESLKNIIIISGSFNADETETTAILELINSGNNVFISAHNFSGFFAEKFNIKTSHTSFVDSTNRLNFYNNCLKREDDYLFKKSAVNIYFSDFYNENLELLAYSKNDLPIFIRYSIGSAYLYLNTTPEVFTNYAMITEKNYEFAFKALSYIPVNDIVWDEYYKEYKKNEKSSFDYIFLNDSFRYAYYLLLILALIFVIFTARRRQRIIPIIKPFKNTSIDFAKTIGRLYYHSSIHKDIAEKKFNYLNYFVKSKYFIDLADEQKVDYKKYAEKTGTEVETIKKVLLTHAKIHKLDKISSEQLNSFNNYIEDFYETCK